MSDLDDLFQAARSAMTRAYVPYSRFRVGAAILADDGQTYVGCNVENAAYPNGVCAETSAISAMVMGGGYRIRTIMITGDGAEPCTPCGGCRQRIREFAAADIAIHVADANGVRLSFTMNTLLPSSFGPENLAP